MNTNSPSIPADVAAHVLFHYGHDGGYQAGSFTTSLISTIDMADEANRDRLSTAFPEYVAAVTAIKYDPDSVAHLQAIVRGGTNTDNAEKPQCPEALFNPDSGVLLRCVRQDLHTLHRTPSGTHWSLPAGSGEKTPF
ncbi:hypothetical protein [Streptomyces althioticus]|uniref:hypothetical protein n=1 Tax=Streptomyces althioticus TaxID=83380 RepID=UPI0033FCA649